MRDEADIVKELRELERSGTLKIHIWAMANTANTLHVGLRRSPIDLVLWLSLAILAPKFPGPDRIQNMTIFKIIIKWL